MVSILRGLGPKGLAMMRNAGRVLIDAVRLAGILMSFWTLVSFSSVAPAISQSNQMCAAPANFCGCATCGCGGTDYGRPTCPAGQSLYDDICLPSCPSGFQRYPGVPGLCMPPCDHGCPDGYDQVPLPNCPDNYVRDLRNPDQCIPDYGKLENEGQCGYGFTYSSAYGKCVADCPQGMNLNEVGQCESTYGRSCAEGMSRDPETGKCIPPGIWPPGYKWVCLQACPSGTFRDIRQPTRCLPPPSICFDGYEDINGRCLPICEKGLTRDNYGYCVPASCPDGTYPNLRGKCQVPDCGPNELRNGNGVCEPPQRGCEQGFETFRGQCVEECKVNSVRDDNGRCREPKPDCPQGQRLNIQLNQCERIPPGTPNCSPNMTYSSVQKKCVTRQPPVVRCNKNEVKDANGRCRPVKDPAPLCPKGFRPDGNGGCLRIITNVPRGCGEGYYLNKRTNKCMPFQNEPDPVQPQDDGGDNGDFEAPPPRSKLNPNILKQLIPQQGDNGGANVQRACADGQYRDENGRCVDKQ